MSKFGMVIMTEADSLGLSTAETVAALLNHAYALSQKIAEREASATQAHISAVVHDPVTPGPWVDQGLIQEAYELGLRRGREGL